MDMESNYLIVVQAFSVVMLAAVGVFPGTTKDSNGKIKINTMGMLMLALGGVIFIATTAMIHSLNQKEQDGSRQGFEDRIDRLYNETANCFATLRVPIPPAPIPNPLGNLRIDAPKGNAQVDWKLDVGGSGAAPKETVWLIVHPIETGAYWVQPPITVREDGTWQVQAYIGRGGTLDSGKRFELMAVGNPRAALNEGQVLDRWPDAEARSNVMAVSRK